MLESNQPLFNQGMDKLNGKKRVAGSLPVYELRQRRRALRITMEGICNQVRQVAGAQRRQTDLLHCCPGFTDCRQPAHQRVRRVDLIVSISADHQQVRQILLDQQILQKVECGRIQPLQIVEKQRQRMFRARENADELSKSKVRASFRLLRR